MADGEAAGAAGAAAEPPAKQPRVRHAYVSACGVLPNCPAIFASLEELQKYCSDSVLTQQAANGYEYVLPVNLCRPLHCVHLPGSQLCGFSVFFFAELPLFGVLLNACQRQATVLPVQALRSL